MGVGAIKIDFGEAAPPNGQYSSGQSGRYEHNRYPMRYQQAALEITREVTGDGIIRGRAAGCHRYPVHWGGDAESTNQGLASSLRGGYPWVCLVLAFGAAMPVALPNAPMKIFICAG